MTVFKKNGYRVILFRNKQTDAPRMGVSISWMAATEHPAWGNMRNFP